MRKILVPIFLIILCLFAAPLSATAEEVQSGSLYDYIQSLDPYISLEASSSGSGYIFTMDTSNYDRSYQGNLHAFFWDAVQILNWFDESSEYQSLPYLSLSERAMRSVDLP